MPCTLCLFVVGLFALSSLSIGSAVTVTNVKASTSTTLHRCKLFTKCRQVKVSFGGGTLNPYFCAYSINGQFECEITSSPPAAPALADSACRSMVEQKPGITALDEFMYLSKADIQNEVACAIEAIPMTLPFSSDTQSSVDHMTSVATIGLAFLVSTLTLSVV